jgi:hypothetical protein
MMLFPVLLIIVPAAIIGLLFLCFGPKKETQAAWLVVSVIASLLIDYVVWSLNHKGSQ